ncbi:MAG TPA: CDP-alcohol phosphatidyltransferase family protein [Stellaceae bacterium]|nr:CDP-alcohol phosphatidyltransferase family protein [Stellaceae bacterium]
MSPRPLLIDAGWQLALLGGALAVVALALMPLTGLGWHGLAATLVAYGAIVALVLAGLGQHAPHRRFGPANRVTLLRAAYTALLVGILAEGLRIGEAGRWVLVASGAAALALDGIDGWAARRSGVSSRFGARFDMESDALFVLALSALVYRTGQAGARVLTLGAMRYIFVVAGWLWPLLTAPLPPSTRRKGVCVCVLVAMLVALAPPVTPMMGRWLCLGGLLLLAYSFAADCFWLAFRGRGEAPAPELR